MNVYVKIFDKNTSEYYGTFRLDRNENGLFWMVQFWSCEVHTHIKKDRVEGYNKISMSGQKDVFLSFEFKEGDLDGNNCTN